MATIAQEIANNGSLGSNGGTDARRMSSSVLSMSFSSFSGKQ